MATLNTYANNIRNFDRSVAWIYAFTESADYPLVNALGGAESDDFARLTLTYNASSERINFVQYEAFDLSSIPDGSVITKISYNIKFQVTGNNNCIWCGLELIDQTRSTIGAAASIFHYNIPSTLQTVTVDSDEYNLGSLDLELMKESMALFYLSHKPGSATAYVDLYGITMTVTYTPPPTPTITIGTPSTTKISSISGYDRATVTFQSDIPLQSWEARATLPGITPSHGVGLLVESGTSLAASTNATVHVDDEELTNGDNEYTITVFGHGTNGCWSDGSFEGINIFDLSTDISEIGYATISGDSVVFDTGTSNSLGGEIKVQLLTSSWEFISILLFEDSTGIKVVHITKTSDFDWIQIANNGDMIDSYIMIDSSIMNVGDTYELTFNAVSLSVNHAEINGISLARVVV